MFAFLHMHPYTKPILLSLFSSHMWFKCTLFKAGFQNCSFCLGSFACRITTHPWEIFIILGLLNVNSSVLQQQICRGAAVTSGKECKLGCNRVIVWREFSIALHYTVYILSNQKIFCSCSLFCQSASGTQNDPDISFTNIKKIQNSWS